MNSRFSKAWLVLPLIACPVFISPRLNADPAHPDINKVPQVFLEEHAGWEDLYRRTFEIAFSKIQQGTAENGFVSFYMDEAFNPNIFQWDTSFMMMFGRYGNQELPSIVSLENFYQSQHDDGWISRELYEKDGTSYWPKSGDREANCSINPPLFSWAEWQDFQVKGDPSRFTKLVKGKNKTIFQVLVDYFVWIKTHRRWNNQLYWTTSWANGMDESPRLGTHHVCDHNQASWIDITAQQALNALYIAKIAGVVGDIDVKQRFEQEHADLKKLINDNFWDEQDGFYFDLDKEHNFYKVKTPASFWTFIAEVSSPQQEQRIIEEHILNPDRFWTLHHIPTVAADEKGYKKDGGYWDGAVWAPTTYQTIKGLEVRGYNDVARKIAINHIEHLYWVYRDTNTLYENYRPEEIKKGVSARPDFVGWSGVGPIAALIENVMGIQAIGAEDSLVWDLQLAERHGISNLQFGDNTVSLLAEDRLKKNAGTRLTIQTDSPFLLKVKHNGKLIEYHIDKGKFTIEVGEIDPHLKSISLIHKGIERQVFGTLTGHSEVYQSFKNSNNPVLSGVNLKIKRSGLPQQSDLTVALFNEHNGKPIGEALAKVTVEASNVDSMYSNIHADLNYRQLEMNKNYVIVLNQISPSDTAFYEWLTGVDVSTVNNFGRLQANIDQFGQKVSTWQPDHKSGDAWMKVYTSK